MITQVCGASRPLAAVHGSGDSWCGILGLPSGPVHVHVPLSRPPQLWWIDRQDGCCGLPSTPRPCSGERPGTTTPAPLSPFHLPFYCVAASKIHLRIADNAGSSANAWCVCAMPMLDNHARRPERSATWCRCDDKPKGVARRQNAMANEAAAKISAINCKVEDTHRHETTTQSATASRRRHESQPAAATRDNAGALGSTACFRIVASCRGSRSVAANCMAHCWRRSPNNCWDASSCAARRGVGWAHGGAEHECRIIGSVAARRETQEREREREGEDRERGRDKKEQWLQRSSERRERLLQVRAAATSIGDPQEPRKPESQWSESGRNRHRCRVP